MSNSLITQRTVDRANFKVVNGWTVETVPPDEESEKRKFEWIATITSKCEILVAKKYRCDDYIVDIYLKIKGEGDMGFSYTPYDGDMSVETTLKHIVKECETVLIGLAVQQWECLKTSGYKAQ